MTVRRIPHLLVLAALAAATTTGLAACGGESLNDVAPKSSPAIVPPDGAVETGSGSGDTAGSISDLPTTTTGPTPAPQTSNDGSGGSSDSTSGSSDSGSTGGSSSGSDSGSSSGSTGGGTSGGAAVTPNSGSGNSGSGSGNSGGGSGTSTSGGGSSGSSGSGSSDSSGGAAPSEFNEFCETNPGVCR